jgi:succinyl-CoA synthetase beta subunit
MARKKVREYHGKKILKEQINRFSRLSFAAQVKPVLVTKETLATEWKKLKATYPWLTEERLVAKPDMLFGKRGKYGLVKVNADLKEVKQFIKEKIDQPFSVGEVQGQLTHWLIEPFVPHDVEFYFSIESDREETIVRFSHKGGIYVEENWDKVKELKVPVGNTMSDFSQVSIM